MNIASLPSVDLHWKEDGNPHGRPIVFANSLGTDLRLWDAIVPLLPKELRIIRFDKRGHGLSSNPTGPYTMTDLVRDTERFLDHLDVKECLFVGLSIGGMIGQSLAANRPDLIRAMVLSNTAARMGDPVLWQQRIARIEKDGMQSISDAILTRWFSSAFLASKQSTAWSHMLQRTPLNGYTGCCHAIAGADLREQAASLRLPVLGIAGAEDGASSPDLVEETITLIPDAQFHVIKGVGHLPCVENPQGYAALLCKFIEETGHD